MVQSCALLAASSADFDCASADSAIDMAFFAPSARFLATSPRSWSDARRAASVRADSKRPDGFADSESAGSGVRVGDRRDTRSARARRPPEPRYLPVSGVPGSSAGSGAEHQLLGSRGGRTPGDHQHVAHRVEPRRLSRRRRSWLAPPPHPMRHCHGRTPQRPRRRTRPRPFGSRDDFSGERCEVWCDGVGRAKCEVAKRQVGECEVRRLRVSSRTPCPAPRTPPESVSPGPQRARWAARGPATATPCSCRSPRSLASRSPRQSAWPPRRTRNWWAARSSRAVQRPIRRRRRARSCSRSC